MPTQGKQVATIAGHQYLDFGRGRTGEDQVVVGVAADRLGPATGAATSSAARSTSSCSTACHRSGSKPIFSARIRCNSTSAGRGRTSSSRPSIVSSRIRLGGPAEMKAETRTSVSQAIRRISDARGATRRPRPRCPPGRCRSPSRARARSAAVRETLDLQLATPGVADELTSGLVEAPLQGVDLLGEIVGKGHGEETADTKASNRGQPMILLGGKAPCVGTCHRRGTPFFAVHRMPVRDYLPASPEHRPDALRRRERSQGTTW